MRNPFKRRVLPPKIERLVLEPGDVLVVKTSAKLTQQQAVDIRDQLKPKFIDHEILMIPSEITLSVVSVPPTSMRAVAGGRA